MKTMWFTFFYCPVLPMGIVISLVGMIFYYWYFKSIKSNYRIDKYNILRRRTVKDSIDVSLTIEMIEMLEWILPLFAVIILIYINIRLVMSFLSIIYTQQSAIKHGLF